MDKLPMKGKMSKLFFRRTALYLIIEYQFEKNMKTDEIIFNQNLFADHWTRWKQHPTKLPCLVSWDFFLFHKLKMYLNGKRYGYLDDIKRHTTTLFHTLSKKVFQNSLFCVWQTYKLKKIAISFHVYVCVCVFVYVKN